MTDAEERSQRCLIMERVSKMVPRFGRDSRLLRRVMVPLRAAALGN